jgi:arsenate reductase
MVTIYHNPRCSKSRQTLDLIEQAGKAPDVVLYLKDKPSTEILQKALEDIGRDKLLRTGEDVYKDHIKDKDLSDKDLISIIQEHPIVMERPLVINGDKMALGRPPESVKEIL